MKKLIITFIVMFVCSMSVQAAKLPADVTNYIKKDFPKAEIRFDGLVTINDTLYLPLFPAKVLTPQKFGIAKTVPSKKTLKDLPDIVVFNTDFVLLKVINTKDGKKTVLFQSDPFVEIRTGLLPQDLLVPRGLIIPENIKTIMGGLKIATAQDKGLKIQSDLAKNEKVVHTDVKKDLVATVPQLKGKNLYIITCRSKNIHVVPSESSRPEYALSLPFIPIDIKAYNDKFILATTFDTKKLNVISLADEAVIKSFEFDAQPEEIVLDKKTNKAYISVPTKSSIYVIDLTTMLLKQKIQVNGMCKNLYLTPDSSKLIYVDKNTNDVWSVELNNAYTIKEVGIFPNVSSIVYSNNKIYLTSRTKNKLAIIDYVTMTAIKEIDISTKPVDMLLFDDYVYILSAQNCIVQVVNTKTDKITNTIKLNTNGFATKLYRLDNTNLALVTDAKAGKYSVLSLDKKQVIKTLPISIPISEIAVMNKVKKINK